MADIIDFAARKKERTPPSFEQLVDDATHFVMTDWEKFAKANKLNDFFTASIQVWATEGVHYISDLNAVATIEAKLGIAVTIRAPCEGHHGWQAGAMLKTGIMFTPDLAFETYARCFNILMFIKLKRDLLTNGMADQL